MDLLGPLLQGPSQAVIMMCQLGLQSSEGSTGERSTSKPTPVVVGIVQLLAGWRLKATLSSVPSGSLLHGSSLHQRTH